MSILSRRALTASAVFGIVLAALAAWLIYASMASAVNYYVDPAGNDANLCTAPGAAACLTINGAIGKAAVSGDVIQVAAGTYTENVVLNKSINIEGAQVGVDACGRVGASESTVTGAGLLWELQTGSAGSTINGFSFSGGTRSIESTTGPLDNLNLLNNRMFGFTNAGVFFNDNGLNITADQNSIDGTSKVGAGDLFHLDTDNADGFWLTNNCIFNGDTATGFFADGSHNVDNSTAGSRTPRITGNLIDNNNTGINLGSRAFGFGTISGNTFSNNNFDGVQGGIQDTSIDGNAFLGNGRDGLVFTSFGNMGADRGGQRTTVTNNCFEGNGFTSGGTAAGLAFSAIQLAGTIATNTATGNNIVGNNRGLRYTGTETIVASGNYWGAADGPSAPGGTGSGDSLEATTVVYLPFLVAPNPAVPTPPCPPPVTPTPTDSPTPIPTDTPTPTPTDTPTPTPVVTDVPGTCTSTALDISTGSAGIGFQDPIWTIVSAPIAGDAYGITPHPAYVIPPAGSNWIHSGNTPGTDNQPIGTYEYEMSFVVPGNATSFTINAQIAVDNDVFFTIDNGPPLPGWTLSGSSTTNFQVLHTVTYMDPSPTATTHVLQAHVFNSGGPTALLVDGDVTCTEATPTPVPTDSPTPVPTDSPTPVPTDSPTPVPTDSPTPVPTDSPTPVPTNSPTPVPTNSPTPVPTNSPTPVPTNTPAPTPVPTTVGAVGGFVDVVTGGSSGSSSSGLSSLAILAMMAALITVGGTGAYAVARRRND
jgi:hypothetical protein